MVVRGDTITTKTPKNRTSVPRAHPFPHPTPKYRKNLTLPIHTSTKNKIIYKIEKTDIKNRKNGENSALSETVKIIIIVINIE